MTLWCTLLGHKYEKVWETAFTPALGIAELEKKECQRCGYKVPTGQDRPL